MTSIELAGVSLYGADGVLLLDDVDLTVPSGETVVICGPPGAGKTALLRVLMGLDEQSEGDIYLDNVLVNAVGPRERDLAMVFQDYALHPRLNVRKNLAFAARLRSHDKYELAERVDDVAGVLALSALLELRPAELDAAQRQRVAIGRAMARDALGYIFDEPFAAQPDRVRTHVRSVVAQWQRDGEHTSILTTSQIDEALTVSDRVVVLHQGVVRQVGTPEQIYLKPADLFVAAFFAHPPMNLLVARREGQWLVSPLLKLEIDDELDERLAGRESIIIGIRPEHCIDNREGAADAMLDALQITAVVEDSEWRGGTQLVYLRYQIDGADEQEMEQVEDDFDFDLFQPFFVAELPASRDGLLVRMQPGQRAEIAVPRELLQMFCLQSGVTLDDAGPYQPVAADEQPLAADAQEAGQSEAGHSEAGQSEAEGSDLDSEASSDGETDRKVHDASDADPGRADPDLADQDPELTDPDPDPGPGPDPDQDPDTADPTSTGAESGDRH